MKPRKGGEGRCGYVWNSGWYCDAKKKGCPNLAAIEDTEKDEEGGKKTGARPVTAASAARQQPRTVELDDLHARVALVATREEEARRL
jgi:hypothetical protein